MHNFISVLGSENDCNFNWTLNWFVYMRKSMHILYKMLHSCMSLDVLLIVRLNDFDSITSFDHSLNTF